MARRISHELLIVTSTSGCPTSRPTSVVQYPSGVRPFSQGYADLRTAVDSLRIDDARPPSWQLSGRLCEYPHNNWR